MNTGYNTQKQNLAKRLWCLFQGGLAQQETSHSDTICTINLSGGDITTIAHDLPHVGQLIAPATQRLAHVLLKWQDGPQDPAVPLQDIYSEEHKAGS